jgi:FAD/FMN-containing dehydrogenase
VPNGWFLPVTPGTKFITVGGAIANDVHGKNHHRAGTFGRHVVRFELLRSNGERLICSPRKNSELFTATIGGLGLTGVITWAEFKLARIHSPMISVESIKFESLEEFIELSDESDREYEYTVAWISCSAGSESIGKGIFLRGNHAPPTKRKVRQKEPKSRLSVPISFPGFAINKLTIRAFNALYYGKQRKNAVSKAIHYDPFFYPLDGIGNWNRVYGKRGFLQYQFAVPFNGDISPVRRVLTKVILYGTGSFVTVLKKFGDVPSPGMLSFPRKGITLALDLPNKGRRTFDLLDQLDEIVFDSGGALYPAKDSRMSPDSFNKSYPNWKKFARHIDPRFSSSFWRRVTGKK